MDTPDPAPEQTPDDPIATYFNEITRAAAVFVSAHEFTDPAELDRLFSDMEAIPVPEGAPFTAARAIASACAMHANFAVPWRERIAWTYDAVDALPSQPLSAAAFPGSGSNGTRTTGRNRGDWREAAA